MAERYYIGIGSTFHDPSLAIVDGEGNVLFAEASERHYQNKRAIGLPADNIIWSSKIIEQYCASGAQYVISASWSNTYIKRLKRISAFGLLKSPPSALVTYYLQNIYRSILPADNLLWLLNKHLGSLISAGKSLEYTLRRDFKKNNISKINFDHHDTHAALACYGSDIKRAVCMVADGGGEEGSMSAYKYVNGRIELLYRQRSPESLGFFYALLTDCCGFDPIKGEEWKVMGLAPYGKYDEKIFNLLKSFFYVEKSRLRYNITSKVLNKTLEALRAVSLSSKDGIAAIADIAYAGQMAYENWMDELLQDLYKRNISENLVLTGGCALNSTYNGKILQQTAFKHLFVPSAPGDDGNSLGAALLAYHNDHPTSKPADRILTPYLGSEIKNDSLAHFLKFSKIEKIRHLPNTICEETAKLLAEGKLVAWVQGKAEFGPRSLGNRSILADPRPEDMKDKINGRVKFREEFRPFAPSILHEYGNEYFEDYQESPYMERTLAFRKSVIHKVPAVVHVNNSGRIQTVKREWNARYHDLIKAFFELTGVPILLNTSFNVMSKPIIHTLEDAISVFYTSGLDIMVINDYIIEK